MSDWNGLPDQPERSGWHVIACGAPRAVWWDAESHYWWDRERRFYITIPEIKASSRSYEYLGAVYSSSELAQMRKDERERAAQVCERWTQTCGAIYDLNPTDYSAGEADACEGAARDIRALPDEEGKKS